MPAISERVYEGLRGHCMKHDLIDRLLTALAFEDIDKDGEMTKFALKSVFHKGL